jgi:hypothetical protein
MAVKVTSADSYVWNLETRLPFSFGAVTLDRFPHVFVEATVEIDGREQAGIAADNVVPKWFVKRADQTVREDIETTLEVIDAACRLGERCEATTPFELWQVVYGRTETWAADTRHPPLLWGFGVSFVERAVIDAFCRARDESFAEAVRSNSLGIDLGAMYPELDGRAPAEFLPSRPLDSVAVRHTVGHSDPLSDDDVPADDQLHDGLPQSLEEYVRTDGVRYFKVKLTGTVTEDVRRLRDVATVVDRSGLSEYVSTVDANEQYDDLSSLRELWEAVRADPALEAFVENLRFVEQPLPRDVAFAPETTETLREWEDRPPIIIDESDAEPDSLATALDCGYDGTSHKNCKGVFTGITNACLLEYRRQHDPGRDYVLSGEDLTTVGPVSLLQDLATVATLGIGHVERNGHHYLRGLGSFPDAINDRVLANHGDLYRQLDDGVAALDVEVGEVALASVVDAPFGVGMDVDPTAFTPIGQWSVDSLDL